MTCFISKNQDTDLVFQEISKNQVFQNISEGGIHLFSSPLLFLNEQYCETTCDPIYG